jgi:multimeric flavodoxin WrbA
MKIIALLGSPRKAKSNTGALLDLVLAGARSEGAESEVIALPGNTVKPCLACDVCHVTGTCGQKDDYPSIREKILAADGVVLATPNYINSVSAQLKAFLDRCCGAVHCLGFEGRYGVAVVTSGGGPEEPIARYLEYFMVTTGISPVGSVWATMGMSEKVFPEEVNSAANDPVNGWSGRSHRRSVSRKPIKRWPPSGNGCGGS